MANVCESGESLENVMANVGKSGESRIFPKNTILANASTRQKCGNFGEYLHSQNLRASCHCLPLICLQNNREDKGSTDKDEW
jgi:hypothetical protein